MYTSFFVSVCVSVCENELYYERVDATRRSHISAISSMSDAEIFARRMGVGACVCVQAGVHICTHTRWQFDVFILLAQTLDDDVLIVNFVSRKALNYLLKT